MESSKPFGAPRRLLQEGITGPVTAPGSGPRRFDGASARSASGGGKSLRALFALLLLVKLFLAPTLGLPGTAGAQAPPAVPAGAPSGFRLVGTVNSKALSGAVLVDAAGLQSFYRLQEKLPDESRIIKVRSDSILLKRTDGMLYELFITQDVTSAAPAAPAADIQPAVPAAGTPGQGADQRRRHSPRKDLLRRSGQEP